MKIGETMIGKRLAWLALAFVTAGCAAAQMKKQLDDRYGQQKVKPREVEQPRIEGVDYASQVQPIFDSRCVVCHGCYDAPCQLKLTAPEGVERGGTKALVYEPSRLTAAKTTRLFEDAQTTEEWRKMNFHPVLNERQRTVEANTEGSLLFRMLELKGTHPLPKVRRLSGFDFSLDRKQSCPTIEEFPKYEKDHPEGGMPYGLPAIPEKDQQTLITWLAQGSKYTPRPPIDAALDRPLQEWEALFNGDSLKERLIARYLYEHLFLAHLYFPEVEPEDPEFFELVRSKTPPGKPLELISTRRPFDDPGVERVYYRLRRLPTTVLLKTHMPYALGAERMRKWKTWFFDASFEVETLPSYDPKTATNPFAAFLQIPVRPRYRFLLDEARYTLEGFIKGPVCRGQTSLNVINDRFWVTFLSPDNVDQAEADFYADQIHRLTLPASNESNAFLLTNWARYADKEQKYLEDKAASLFKKYGPRKTKVDFDLLWKGDGNNQNAALTVMRHDDSATVKQGLLGAPPKTSWVLGYGILERIHYLLVGGFDVFGNVGHQLNTRIYMDFLRMEAEGNFLAFLPRYSRDPLLRSWYVGAEGEANKYIGRVLRNMKGDPNIRYTTRNPELEFYTMLQEQLQPILNREHVIDEQTPADLRDVHDRLEAVTGGPVTLFPQVSWVRIVHEGSSSGDGPEDSSSKDSSSAGGQSAHRYFTILRDNDHKNIMSIFFEDKNRDPKKDRFTVLDGLVGAYPNALFRVTETHLAEFVSEVLAQKDEESYDQLRDRYGMRRTRPDFWKFSDELFSDIEKLRGIEAGRPDYNRLENR